MAEGVMAYNHLKEKVKGFLQPFAQSGQAVSADDVKAYFEKLRGDDEAIKAAGGAALAGGNGQDPDSRREQSGKWHLLLSLMGQIADELCRVVTRFSQVPNPNCQGSVQYPLVANLPNSTI